MVTTLHSTPVRWVPPGKPAAVAGHVIAGGSVYLGQRIPATFGPIISPLIDPDLPVAATPGHHVAPVGGPELAYHLLSPAARKAYLDWQAGGRRADVASGLVLLFCYGLEHRVLIDADDDPAVHRELPALTAETRRLRVRYGHTATVLRDALDNLLDLLELLTAQRHAPAAGVGPDRETPMAVRIALARFAVSSAPIPVAWARAWMRHHPSLTASRSESACPAEFERLFTARYHDRYGDGIVVARTAGPTIRLRYRPAHPGISPALVLRADLPDLLSEPRSIRALTTLRDEVTTALDPYRRWLVRFPQGRDSLAAVPLLPAELIDARHGRLGAVRVWAERRLDGHPRTLIDGAEFWNFWSAASPERMDTDETTALMAVLAKLGLGVEPDVRFGAPPLAPGPAVLFRLGRPSTDRPGPRFGSATAIARCAAAVVSADGPIDPRGPIAATVLATATDLAAALRLAPGEDVRLAARLSWLLTTRVDVERFGRQTTMMTAAEREIAGHYLITVAVTAAPMIGPTTVAVLTRVYRILGLQPDLVFHRLHERSTGGSPVLPRIAVGDTPTVAVRRPAPQTTGIDTTHVNDRTAGIDAGRVERPDEPVVVLPGDHRPNGYALPWAAPTEQRSTDCGTPPTGLRLDRGVIRKKVAESGAAAALLSAIFEDPHEADHGPQPPPAVPAQPVPGLDRAPQPVGGLDRAHGALLHALSERQSWTREEFDLLAAVHGVMPNGALDMLNEVAIDTAGAPLIEGDVTLTVATDILQELLG